jgi:Uma2 family endonuclease
MTGVITKHRFSVDAYHRMAECGLFHPEDRVELLDGEIVDMSPIGSRHAGCVNRLNALLTALLGATAVVSVQNPVILGPHSEPQPEVMLLRPRPDFYGTAHPGPEDVLLIVEVADATLDLDRGVKLPLYARAGIREVWIVDLETRSIEVYRDPSPDGYGALEHGRPGGRVSSQAFPALSISVDEILG